MNEQEQSQELEFTPVEGERPVPIGWWLLFGGLVAFGGFYLWAYSPWLGGWSQGGAFAAGQAGADGGGANVFATVAFTALAVLTAGVLLLALSRRKKQP